MNKTKLSRLHPKFWTPFRWGVFWRKQQVMIQQNGLLKTLPSIGFHMGVYGFNQLGWMSDALLPSKVDTPQLDESVFIVGHQRSGTTFLHRLLAGNDWAHSLNLHEMLFPSSSFQRGLNALHNLDGFFGGHLEHHFNRLQDKYLGHLDNIHRVRFNEVEEDEFVMWSQYASDMCINDSPTLIEHSPSDMPKEFEFWSPTEQYQTLMWYRACVQKKLQRVRGQGLYVGKNPRFSRVLPQLNTVFPQSKIIVLMRNPLEAIPSRMSLMRALWTMRNPEFKELSPEHVQWILHNSIQTYLKTVEGLRDIPADRKIIIGYNDLKTNTRSTLKRLIDHLDLPAISSNVESKLEEMSTRSYLSKHQYNLQDYGLHQSDIERPLKEVFERHQDLF